MEDIFNLALGLDDDSDSQDSVSHNDQGAPTTTPPSTTQNSMQNFNKGEFDTSNPYGKMFSDLADQGLWGDQYGKPVGYGDVHIGSTYTPDVKYGTTAPTQTTSTPQYPRSTNIDNNPYSAQDLHDSFHNFNVDTTSRQTGLQSWAPVLQYVQNKTGLSADAVAGLMVAENGVGQSEISKSANNYFSIHYANRPGQQGDYNGTSAASYGNPLDSLNDFVDLISTSPRYAQAWKDRADPTAFYKDLADAGYIQPDGPVDQWMTNMMDGVNQFHQAVPNSTGARAEAQPDTTSTGADAPAVQAVAADVRSGNVPSLHGITPQQGQIYAGDTDVWSLCGPVAAMAFVKRMGRQPSPEEAKQLAISVGWTPASGMAGVDSEVALLNKMGIAAHKTSSIDWNAVAKDVQNGNPVIIDTPGHYFTVEGYDPNTGKFDFGGVAGVWTAAGNNTWFKPEELAGLSGKYDLNPRAAIFMDNPGTPAPSVVAGASPNKPAASTTTSSTTTTATGTLPYTPPKPQAAIRADNLGHPLTLWDIAMGTYDVAAPIARPPQINLNQAPTTTTTPAKPAAQPAWLQQHQQQDAQARQQAASTPAPVTPAAPTAQQTAIKAEKDATDKWQADYEDWVKKANDITAQNVKARQIYEANNAQNQTAQLGNGDMPQQDDLRPDELPVPPPPPPPATPNIDAIIQQKNDEAQKAYEAQGNIGLAPDQATPVSVAMNSAITKAQGNFSNATTVAADNVLDTMAPAINLLSSTKFGPAIPDGFDPNKTPVGAHLTIGGQDHFLQNYDDIDDLPSPKDAPSDVVAQATATANQTAAGYPHGTPFWQRTYQKALQDLGYVSDDTKATLKNQLSQQQMSQDADTKAENNPNALPPQSSAETLANSATAANPALWPVIAARQLASPTTGEDVAGSYIRTAQGGLAAIRKGLADFGKQVGSVAMGAGATEIGAKIYQASADAAANTGLNSKNENTVESTIEGLAPMIPLTIATVLTSGAALPLEAATGIEGLAATAGTAGSIANSAVFAIQGAGSAYDHVIKNGGSTSDATAAMVIAGALNAGLATHTAGEALAAPMNYMGDRMLPALTKALAPALNTTAGKALIEAGKNVSPELVRNFLVEAGKMGAINMANVSTEDVFTGKSASQIASDIASSTPDALLQGGVLGTAFHMAAGRPGTESHNVEARPPVQTVEKPADLITNVKDENGDYHYNSGNLNTGKITNFDADVLNRLPHQVPDISDIADPMERRAIMVANLTDAERITGGLNPDQRADIFHEFDPNDTLTPEERTDLAEQAHSIVHGNGAVEASAPRDVFESNAPNPAAVPTVGQSTLRTGDQTVLPGLEPAFGEGPEQPATPSAFETRPQPGDRVEIATDNGKKVQATVTGYNRDKGSILLDNGTAIYDWGQSGDKIISTASMRGERPQTPRTQAGTLPLEGVDQAPREDQTSQQTLPFDAEPTAPRVARRNLPKADGTPGERPTLATGGTSDQKANGINIPDLRVQTPEIGDHLTVNPPTYTEGVPARFRTQGPISGQVVRVETKPDGSIVPWITTENGGTIPVPDWQIRGRTTKPAITLGEEHTVQYPYRLGKEQGPELSGGSLQAHLPGMEPEPARPSTPQRPLDTAERDIVNALHERDDREANGEVISKAETDARNHRFAQLPDDSIDRVIDAYQAEKPVREAIRNSRKPATTPEGKQSLLAPDFGPAQAPGSEPRVTQKKGQPPVSRGGPFVDTTTAEGRRNRAATVRAETAREKARIAEEEKTYAPNAHGEDTAVPPGHEGTAVLPGEPPTTKAPPISETEAETIRNKQRAEAGRPPRLSKAQKAATVTPTEPRTISSLPEVRDTMKGLGDKTSKAFEKSLAAHGDNPTNEQVLQSAHDAVWKDKATEAKFLKESSADVADAYKKAHPTEATPKAAPKKEVPFEAKPESKPKARQTDAEKAAARVDDAVTIKNVDKNVPGPIRVDENGMPIKGDNNGEDKPLPAGRSARATKGSDEGQQPKRASTDSSSVSGTKGPRIREIVRPSTEPEPKQKGAKAKGSAIPDFVKKQFGNLKGVEKAEAQGRTGYKESPDEYIFVRSGRKNIKIGVPDSVHPKVAREIAALPDIGKVVDRLTSIHTDLTRIADDLGINMEGEGSKMAGLTLDPEVFGYNMRNTDGKDQIHINPFTMMGVARIGSSDPAIQTKYLAGQMVGTIAHEIAHSSEAARTETARTGDPHNPAHEFITELIKDDADSNYTQTIAGREMGDIWNTLTQGAKLLASSDKYFAADASYGEKAPTLRELRQQSGLARAQDVPDLQAQMATPGGPKQRIQAPTGFDKRKFSRDAQQDLLVKADDIVKSGRQMSDAQIHAAVASEFYGNANKTSLVRGNLGPHLSSLEMQAVLEHVKDQKAVLGANAARIAGMTSIKPEDIRDLAVQGIKYRAAVEQMQASKKNIKAASKDYTVARQKAAETADQFTDRILKFAQTNPGAGKAFAQSVADASALNINSAEMGRKWDTLIHGKTTLGDWVGGLFYGGILGPGTAGKALIGNTSQVLFKIPMDFARTAVHHPGALGAVTKMEGAGIIHGFVHGIHAMADIMYKGFTDQVNGLENSVPLDRLHNNRTGLKVADKTLNGLGYVVEGWDRLFVSADAFTRAIGYGMEKGRQAGLEAERQGDTSWKNVQKIYNDPTQFIHEEATRAGAETAFQSNPGDWGNTLMKIQNSGAVGRWMVPFVRTTYNSMQTGLERTPVGFLLAAIDVAKADGDTVGQKVRNANADYKIRPVEERLWNSIVGSTIGLGIYGAIKSGNIQITGAAPTTQKERDAWTAEGKIPWGIRMKGPGDSRDMKDIPMKGYQWAGDAAVGLALMAEGLNDANDISKGKDPYLATRDAALRFAKGYTQMSVYSSVASILTAATQGQPLSDQYFGTGAEKIAESTAEAFIPTGATGYAVGNAQDETVRYPTANTFKKRVVEDIASRMPMYMPFGMPQRSDLKPALNEWGAPQVNKNYAGGDITKPETYIKGAVQFFFPGIILGGAVPSRDPVDQEIIRLYHSTDSTDSVPSRAPTDYQGHKFEDPDEKYEWQRRVGQNSYYLANRTMQTPEYQKADDATKNKYLKAVYQEAESSAWGSMDIQDDKADPGREPKYNGIKNEATQENKNWWDLEKEADRAIVKVNDKADAQKNHRDFAPLSPREQQLANRYRGNINPRYTQENQKDRETLKKAIGAPTDLPFVAVP